MKKTTLLAYCFLLVTAFSFNSCDTENIDPAVVDNNVNPDPEGGVSTGDYWPTAVNNEWVYKRNGVIQEPMRFIGTETIGGKIYYKFNNFFTSSTEGTVQGAQETTYINKLNGVYSTRTVVVSNIAGFGFTISPIETILLKDYLAQGETWTQQIPQIITYNIPGVPPMTMEINTVGTIEEKGISLTVNNVNYTDVIKVKLIMTTSALGQSEVPVTNYYWFAKNHGLIKYKNLVEGMNYDSELISHVIN